MRRGSEELEDLVKRVMQTTTCFSSVTLVLLLGNVRTAHNNEPETLNSKCRLGAEARETRLRVFDGVKVPGRVQTSQNSPRACIG